MDDWQSATFHANRTRPCQAGPCRQDLGLAKRDLGIDTKAIHNCGMWWSHMRHV